MRNRLVIALLAFFALPAAADVISVAPRDSDGLVAAIEQANRSPGEDIIELAPGSLYALRGASEPGGTQALPTIRSRIRILGNKAEIRRYADAALLLVSVAPAGSPAGRRSLAGSGSRARRTSRPWLHARGGGPSLGGPGPTPLRSPPVIHQARSGHELAASPRSRPARVT